MLSSYLSVFYVYASSYVLTGLGRRVYLFVLFVLLGCFFSLRLPYVFGVMGFGVLVFYFILPIFFALFLCRLRYFYDFSASFVPEGSPQKMAFFVRFAELISYIIRPLVLILRPFVKLSLGCLVSHELWSSLAGGSGFYMLFLGLLLFFYEVFVTLVH